MDIGITNIERFQKRETTLIWSPKPTRITETQLRRKVKYIIRVGID